MQAPGKNNKGYPFPNATNNWSKKPNITLTGNQFRKPQTANQTPGSSAPKNVPGVKKSRKRTKRKNFHSKPLSISNTPFLIFSNHPITILSTNNMDFTQDVEDLVDDTHNSMGNFRNDIAAKYEETTIKKPFTMQIKKDGEKSELAVKVTQEPAGDVTQDNSDITPVAEEKQDEVASNLKLANQELRECLASDIKTVVRDNVKLTPGAVQPQIRMRHINTKQYPNVPYIEYRKGIPRSFLIRDMETNMNLQQGNSNQQTFGQTTTSPQVGSNPPISTPNQQPYSPSSLYNEYEKEEKDVEQDESDTSDCQPGDKRVSAFQRLGPQTEMKKPKLTINLSFNKEEAVREVVNESEIKVYKPVPEREDIQASKDEIVQKYLPLWPWSRTLIYRWTAKHRHSKSAMLMEREQMDETYQRDNAFVQVSVSGYPNTWTKEDVLDILLERLEGKTFIPCFIEFNERECRFLVIRCRSALLAIHNLDFHIYKDDVELYISVSLVSLTGLQLDFIPRVVLKKRLFLMAYNSTEHKLDLNAFTLQPDISHFIYFPLHRPVNQTELMALKSDIIWSHLIELNLSHNKLTCLNFNLERMTPRLKHLDISHNHLEKITILLNCRNIPLTTLRLEGNPLCHDYTDPSHYVDVVKMMYPQLRELDGKTLYRKGEVPAFHRNYCPEDAEPIIDKFLQVYFPLLDCHSDGRMKMVDLYASDAVVTITYSNKLGIGPEYKLTRSLLFRSRVLLDGDMETVSGLTSIQKLAKQWPNFQHDPLTFTVDVLHHGDTSTIFRVDGILKILADSLADNDQLVAFSRTFHLHTADNIEYTIKNEMIYWAQPTSECADSAFKLTAVMKKSLGFKFESPPDDISKQRLLETFMNLTSLQETLSERCLMLKNWDLKEALDHFIKLYKNNDLHKLLAST